MLLLTIKYIAIIKDSVGNSVCVYSLNLRESLALGEFSNWFENAIHWQNSGKRFIFKYFSNLVCQEKVTDTLHSCKLRSLTGWTAGTYNGY